MCNCYGHKCEVCDVHIPMHISNFDYPETDFKVWCDKHLELAESGSVIFTITKQYDSEDLREYPVGWQCAILGPEVEANTNGPNLYADFELAVVEK